METTNGTFDAILSDLNNLNTKYGSTLDITKLIVGLNEIKSYDQNQNIMDNVLEKEDKELNDRLKKMNYTIDTSKRNYILNESVRLKTADYNVMLYYFILMMMTISFLLVFNKLVPIVPSAIMEMFIIVIVCTFLFLIYKKYVDIANRDIINYNEVSLVYPDNVSLNDKQIAELNKQNSGNGTLFNLNPVKCDQNKEMPVNMTTTPVNMTTTPVNMTTTPVNMTTTPVNMTTTPVNVNTGIENTLASSNNNTTPITTSGVTVTAIPKDNPAQTTLTTNTKNAFTLMKDAEPNSFYEYSNYSVV
jgi:hypothetical protein